MTKKDRRRLLEASKVAIVCLVIHFAAELIGSIKISRKATEQLEKVRRWNGEALHGFGILDQKDSRQTVEVIHEAYVELAKELSPRLEALPEEIFLGATAVCVDTLLADSLTGRREIRRTPAMRYLVQTWETLTLVLSTGEDEAAEEGTRIYMEVA